MDNPQNNELPGIQPHEAGLDIFHLKELNGEELQQAIASVAKEQTNRYLNLTSQGIRPQLAADSWGIANNLAFIADHLSEEVTSSGLCRYPKKYGLLPAAAELLDMHLHTNELKQFGLYDGLTGALTRNGFQHLLQSKHQMLSRTTERRHTPQEPLHPLYQSPYGAIYFIDADYFGDVNKRYGHNVGDQLLQILAQAFRNIIREEEDIFIRYGGEEFCVLQPGTDSENGLNLHNNFTEEYHRLIKEANLPPPLQQATVTIGAANYSNQSFEAIRTAGNYDELRNAFHKLAQPANEALLKGKANGRNRVEVV